VIGRGLFPYILSLLFLRDFFPFVIHEDGFVPLANSPFFQLEADSLWIFPLSFLTSPGVMLRGFLPCLPESEPPLDFTSFAIDLFSFGCVPRLTRDPSSGFLPRSIYPFFPFLKTSPPSLTLLATQRKDAVENPLFSGRKEDLLNFPPVLSARGKNFRANPSLCLVLPPSLLSAGSSYRTQINYVFFLSTLISLYLILTGGNNFRRLPP